MNVTGMPAIAQLVVGRFARMSRRIVLVEDDLDIAEALAFSLKKAGFEISLAYDGNTALEVITARPPQLIILDLMIPGADGFEVCERLKSSSVLREIPIIMLTARSDETDIVLGLGLGADDYVVKPFATPELIARVHAVLARGALTQGRAGQSTVVQHGDLVVDSERFEARVGVERIELTTTEFKVLFFLAARPNQVFSRDEILNHAVGEETYVIDRNVDVHVRAIRKKLELASAIKTIRGVGYRFEPEGCQLADSKQAM